MEARSCRGAASRSRSGNARRTRSRVCGGRSRVESPVLRAIAPTASAAFGILRSASIQVLPANTAARWIEALLKIPKAAEAVGAMARRTGDSTRDLPPQTLDLVRRAFPDLDLEAAPRQDLASMGKVFGEELPSGLVFHE